VTTKIAPTLRRAHPRPLTPREVMQGVRREIVTYRADDAYRELRDLLAVARDHDRLLSFAAGFVGGSGAVKRSIWDEFPVLARSLRVRARLRYPRGRTTR